MDKIMKNTNVYIYQYDYIHGVWWRTRIIKFRFRVAAYVFLWVARLFCNRVSIEK